MSAVLDEYLREERDAQLSLAQFHSLETGGNTDKAAGSMKCTNCGKNNHATKDCRSKKKTPATNAADGQTMQKSDCPVCKKTHTWEKDNMKTCTRLSSYPEWRNMAMENQAGRIQTLQGCVIFLY